MIFFIGSQTVTVFLFFILAIALQAGSAVQNVIPVVMWIVLAIDVVIAAKFFISASDGKKNKGIKPFASLISSALAIVTTFFVFQDLSSFSNDGFGGTLLFILELIFAGLPWLIVICNWILANTTERWDPIELHAVFIKEIIGAGIMILFYVL